MGEGGRGVSSAKNLIFFRYICTYIHKKWKQIPLILCNARVLEDCGHVRNFPFFYMPLYSLKNLVFLEKEETNMLWKCAIYSSEVMEFI